MLLKESSSAPGSWLTPRRGMWLLILCAVAVAAVLALRLTQALGFKDSNAKRHELPTVTVTRVAVSTTPTTISIVGTLAARYDMPIGVEGDGGRVAAIYVEAGDRVKRGQVLARLICGQRLRGPGGSTLSHNRTWGERGRAVPTLRVADNLPEAGGKRYAVTRGQSGDDHE